MFINPFLHIITANTEQTKHKTIMLATHFCEGYLDDHQVNKNTV